MKQLFLVLESLPPLPFQHYLVLQLNHAGGPESEALAAAGFRTLYGASTSVNRSLQKVGEVSTLHHSLTLKYSSQILENETSEKDASKSLAQNSETQDYQVALLYTQALSYVLTTQLITVKNLALALHVSEEDAQNIWLRLERDSCLEVMSNPKRTRVDKEQVAKMKLKLVDVLEGKTSLKQVFNSTKKEKRSAREE